MRKLRYMIGLLLALSFLLSGCKSGEKSDEDYTEIYAGTYVGEYGSTIILKKDGTCKYKDSFTVNVVEGKWSVKNKKITASGFLNYSIYAEITDSETTLLFEAFDRDWRDELFTKSE